MKQRRREGSCALQFLCKCWKREQCRALKRFSVIYSFANELFHIFSLALARALSLSCSLSASHSVCVFSSHSTRGGTHAHTDLRGLHAVFSSVACAPAETPWLFQPLCARVIQHKGSKREVGEECGDGGGGRGVNENSTVLRLIKCTHLRAHALCQLCNKEFLWEWS